MQRRDHQRRMALTMARQGESLMKFHKIGGAVAGVVMLWSAAAAAETTEVQIINGLQGGPAVTVVVDPNALMAEVNANVGKGAKALPTWGQLANFTQLVVDVEFEYNSTAIVPSSYRTLGAIADALHHPLLARYKFLVVGHTDATGGADYNLKLSLARAAGDPRRARHHLHGGAEAAVRGGGRGGTAGRSGPSRCRDQPAGPVHQYRRDQVGPKPVPLVTVERAACTARAAPSLVPSMDETETLTRLGLALAIGFLIGVERGWREREQKAGERAAGLRTFALTGLFGGVWGLLTLEVGPAPMGLAFLALAGAATLFRWRETEREGIVGMTTLVAMFLTFSLGALAVLGDMVAAAAAAVATAALLAAKEWLHGWLKVLTWPELRAALILFAMTFVALPVLPDKGYGPYDALNPYQLWLMTIVIAGVSFIGYVATKIAGERFGSLIAGTAGGLVSSTAVTLDFARRTRAAPHLWRPLLSGGLAASTVMFARVVVVVVLFGPGLAGAVVPALAAAALISAVAALVLNHCFVKREGTERAGEAVVQNRGGSGFRDSLAAFLRWILGSITPPISPAGCR